MKRDKMGLVHGYNNPMLCVQKVSEPWFSDTGVDLCFPVKVDSAVLRGLIGQTGNPYIHIAFIILAEFLETQIICSLI